MRGLEPIDFAARAVLALLLGRARKPVVDRAVAVVVQTIANLDAGEDGLHALLVATDAAQHPGGADAQQPCVARTQVAVNDYLSACPVGADAIAARVVWRGAMCGRLAFTAGRVHAMCALAIAVLCATTAIGAFPRAIAAAIDVSFVPVLDAVRAGLRWRGRGC